MVPVGVAGELHIGGVGIARCYINNTELTNEKFVPNPFGEGRLYKTGDVCKWLGNGEVEYIGRSDLQVKLRGLRIELGEIESVMSTGDGVQAAVVMVREHSAGSNILVGFLSPDTIEVSSLKAFMASKLPAYMIPQLFVALATLPLNKNGKVDRKRVAELSLPVTAEEEEAEPRNALEEVILDIWSDILGIDTSMIGLHQPFFEVGGHSLSATQVCLRLSTIAGTKIPLRTLFQQTTVAQLAQYLATQYPIFSQMSEASAKNSQRYRDRESIIGVAEQQRAEGKLRASYAQERMWVSQQLVPNAATYHCYSTCNMRSPLDCSLLRSCVTQLVDRHESLRTTYKQLETKLYQIVQEHYIVPITVVDLSSVPEGLQSLESARVLCNIINTPFNLENDCMLRVAAIKLGPYHHLVLLCIHHIATDGWSMDIIEREFKALQEGRELHPLRIQYADFAEWQREWLQGEVLDKQQKYWQEVLSGYPPILQLPTDRPRPPAMNHKGATLSFEVPLSIAHGVKRVAAEAGVSLFACLFSCYFVLLHKFSGQDDIVVGTPIANRNVQDLEHIVGFFVNLLPIRVDISSEPTFKELICTVNDLLITASENQDLPFEELVNALKVERLASITPIFQTIFTLQQHSLASRYNGDDMSFMKDLLLPSLHTSKFDLTLTVVDQAQGFTLLLEYNVDILTSAVVTRMATSFIQLLSNCTIQSDYRLLMAELIDSEERDKLLYRWNHTSETGITVLPKSAHQLFEEQVQNSPDSEALLFDHGSKSISYKDLNAMTNYLAQQLTTADMRTGRDVVIGLCAEQSSWVMVAGMLAVWKTGSAYVPLDPKQPKDRLKHVLKDASVDAVVCQRSVNVFSECDCEIIIVDDSFGLPSNVFTYESAAYDPTSLAYVIYTSGTSGLPKGVAIEHISLTNFAIQCSSAMQYNKSSRVLQSFPFFFDGHLIDTIAPLIVGGTLLLKPSDIIAGYELSDYINKHSITSVALTPSVLATLHSFSMPSLKVVGTGGEALSLNILRAFSGR